MRRNDRRCSASEKTISVARWCSSVPDRNFQIRKRSPAFGALSLLHKDVASEVQHWLDQLRIDPDNQFIGALLSKLELVHTKELKELSALGTGNAALFLTEGTGLLFRKRWAEWLTIVATSSLLPIEVYELVKEFTAIRLLALLINAAVVLYLIYVVRQKVK